MAIRMVDDENQDNDNSGNRRERKDNPGGGGNPLIYFLPKLIGVLFKYPKIGIPLLLVGGVGFFMMNGCPSLVPNSENSSSFSKGCDMKKEIYDQAEVYEPLADNKSNPLPEAVSLLKYAPSRLNQGQQGSCVAWSSAYAARSIMEAREKGTNPDQTAFSPSFLYNQIALENCQGSYINWAMEKMMQIGSVPFNQFPYDENSCSKEPNSSAMQLASGYKTKGFQRLSKDGEDYRVNMLAIKQNLAAGAPVVIGMRVGGSFMQDMVGKDVWTPDNSDYDMAGFGGHAMCVIGYDDFKNGGAFQIMNSWGKEWGNNGIGWVRYSDFDYFVVEAYGLYPMGASDKKNTDRFTVNFGLVDNQTKQRIPLKKIGDNQFESSVAVKKMSRFKVEVNNSIECYTYIFGEESDGSSYVLFPYTKKHSPYCGITGTRLFPKDKSLQPDETGNKDYMAIVVSKSPLDYDKVNLAIQNQSAKGYAAKVNAALNDLRVKNVNFKEGETIGFDASLSESGQVVSMIIAINKN